MFFSVIMPVWNGADHIEGSVRTLVAQTFQDWELIIVNDGSTDATPAIVDKLAAADSRIRVVHQPNGGVSVARNHGLDEAKGEWIAWLDADDALIPTALEVLHDIIQAHSGIACVQSPYLEKQDSGMAPIIPRAYTQFANQVLPGAEAFKVLFADVATRGVNWQPWRFTYRRDCLPRFRPHVIHEDIDVLPMHLAALDSVFISNTPVYVYLPAREGAATATLSPKRVRDILDVTRNLHDKLAAAPSADCPAMSPDVVRGFKGTIAFNLFGYYLTISNFEASEREELFACLESHKEWLTAIDAPPKTAWIKRLMLYLLGIRLTARLFHK